MRSGPLSDQYGARTMANISGTMLAPAKAKTLGWGQSCNCPGHRPIPCTVLDPFAGSGTTLEVADALGRRSVGLEASDKSLADARMRLERPHAPRRRPRRAGAGNHAPLFPESR
jgi:hypothetical protein